MNATPLYDALRDFADAKPLRFHMPGHKGTLSPLDVTELPPTGNLYESGGAIDAAQRLWAEAAGMAHCLFLTNGSTGGLFAALTAATAPGDHVLLDRDCHLSVHHAMAALDLHPQFIWRQPLQPLTAEMIANAMDSQPNCNTVCITSPTYYGVLSDISAISDVVHQRGGTLLVDGAHGAHLPFLLGRDVFQGADLLVLSAHKTLQAYGQSALLFSGGNYSAEDLRRATRIFQTTSPSYLFMAQLDLARAHMEGDGLAAYRRVTVWNRWSLGDPGRAVVHTQGLIWAESLMKKGIFPELWNRDYVIFILTDADSPADLARLEQEIATAPPPLPPLEVEVPRPKRVCSPREAIFAPRETIPLTAAEDRIAAAPVAPYPPGIPVVAPGETLDKKTIAYLNEIMYNNSVDVILE